MTPQPQTVLYGEEATGNGNCMTACIASLLDVPLWMVPPFEQMYGRKDRQQRINAWLFRFFKLDMEWMSYTDSLEPQNTLPEFYIAVGPSPRNPSIGHGVIYSGGVLVHDPHYSGLGILKVESIYYLRPA